MHEVSFGTLLKNKIIETYPEYISKFPNYSKALNIMEKIMNDPTKTVSLFLSDYDKEIEEAIENYPKPEIVIIPKSEPTLLAWNSDYYFDKHYLWKPIKNRNLVTTLELLSEASAWLKVYLSSRVHLILYKKTKFYDLSITEALKLKQTFPITQLLNRVRNYLQIPIIKLSDNDDTIELLKEKAIKESNSERVKKYSEKIKTFESKSGINLTTEEKIEYIAEKMLDEIIQEDYDEIES
jgi:hypothetical protein